MKYKYKIRILYKSGNSFEGWFKEFKCKWNGEQITEASWVNYDAKSCLFLGISNIEAIFKIDRKILIWDSINSIFPIKSIIP